MASGSTNPRRACPARYVLQSLARILHPNGARGCELMNGPSKRLLPWPSEPSAPPFERSARLRDDARRIRLESEQVCRVSRDLGRLSHLANGREPDGRAAARRAIQCSKDLRWVIGLPLFGGPLRRVAPGERIAGAGR